MKENTIDFLWRHSARPDAQAHRVDQVLMNINVNLIKEQEKRGEDRQAGGRLWRKMMGEEALRSYLSLNAVYLFQNDIKIY